jgi:HSP20 family protein
MLCEITQSQRRGGLALIYLHGPEGVCGCVQAEVPGFKANDLEVSLEPQRLAISGKKETSKEDKRKEKLIYQERCSAELFRAIDLPVEVDAAKATAKLKTAFSNSICPR